MVWLLKILMTSSQTSRVSKLIQNVSKERVTHTDASRKAYRAKPTPRPLPFLSRRMREEQTLCGWKRLASSCSFMDFGRLDT